MAAKVKALKLAIMLNISMAAQYLRDFHLSARACTDALELDPTSTKALCACPHPRAL